MGVHISNWALFGAFILTHPVTNNGNIHPNILITPSQKVDINVVRFLKEGKESMAAFFATKN